MANEVTPPAQAPSDAVGTTIATAPLAGTPISESPKTPAEGAAAPVVGDKGGEKPNEPAKETPAAAPLVPEKYELKLAAGALLDQTRVDDIAAYAKQNGLSQEQAQGLLDREQSAVASFAQNQQTQIKQTTDAWLESVKSDKEIGGDKFNENVEMAKRVITKFGTDDFKQQLDKTGLGNHPELIRVFSRVGKAMSEDQLVLPGAKTKAPAKDLADRIYPTTKEN